MSDNIKARFDIADLGDINEISISPDARVYWAGNEGKEIGRIISGEMTDEGYVVEFEMFDKDAADACHMPLGDYSIRWDEPTFDHAGNFYMQPMGDQPTLEEIHKVFWENINRELVNPLIDIQPDQINTADMQYFHPGEDFVDDLGYFDPNRFIVTDPAQCTIHGLYLKDGKCRVCDADPDAGMVVSDSFFHARACRIIHEAALRMVMDRINADCKRWM